MRLSLRFYGLVPLTMLVFLLVGTSPQPFVAAAGNPASWFGRTANVLRSDSDAASSSSRGLLSSLSSLGRSMRWSSSSRHLMPSAPYTPATLTDPGKWLKNHRPTEQELGDTGGFKKLKFVERVGNVADTQDGFDRIDGDLSADQVTRFLTKLHVLAENHINKEIKNERLARQKDIRRDVDFLLSQLDSGFSRKTPGRYLGALEAIRQELNTLQRLKKIIEWSVNNQRRLSSGDMDRLAASIGLLVSEYNERISFCMDAESKLHVFYQEARQERVLDDMSGRAPDRDFVQAGLPKSLQLTAGPDGTQLHLYSGE